MTPSCFWPYNLQLTTSPYKHIQESTFSNPKSSLIIENPLVDCKLKESKEVDSPGVTFLAKFLKSKKSDSSDITLVRVCSKTDPDNLSQVFSSTFEKHFFFSF